MGGRGGGMGVAAYLPIQIFQDAESSTPVPVTPYPRGSGGARWGFAGAIASGGNGRLDVFGHRG
jgi:hypothetical protein